MVVECRVVWGGYGEEYSFWMRLNVSGVEWLMVVRWGGAYMQSSQGLNGSLEI